MKSHLLQRRRLPIAVLAVTTLVLTGCSAGSVVGGGDDKGGASTLTFLADTSDASSKLSAGLAEAYMEENPDVTIEVETRPEGAEGDNVVKTRLSTGDMTDIFMYNTGSLFHALDPEQNIVALTDEAGLDDVQDTFVETVTAGEDVYGVPLGTATGGGVFYNRAVYKELGLDVPTTWDQFMSNNAEIKEAGLDPVIQTYQDTWTSQLFVLGDFHNVAAADPEWADKYTANEVHYAEEPAINGFERLQEVHDADYLNQDFASATLNDGLAMLAKGEGVHYPMLTLALGELYDQFPGKQEDIGFFALPGEDAAKNGLTVWTGGGIYIPTSTEGEKLEMAKDFFDFVASPEGCQAQTEAYPPAGPYFVDGCDLPKDLPPAVTDLLPYFEEGGATTPALEFLSPIKGPALEQITVEVGSGIKTAEAGAALYDQDVKKQAQQLGLPGWD